MSSFYYILIFSLVSGAFVKLISKAGGGIWGKLPAVSAASKFLIYLIEIEVYC